MAIKGTPTKHASEDRLDRITLIAMTIGFGKVLRERMIDDKWYQITDTGVEIVRNENKDTIITMWVANKNQVQKIYGEDPLPNRLLNTIKTNKKKVRLRG